LSKYRNLQGNISANGEPNHTGSAKDSVYDVNGEGGGGFLSMYSLCWFQEQCLEKKFPGKFGAMSECLKQHVSYTQDEPFPVINPQASRNRVFITKKVAKSGENGLFGGECLCGDGLVYNVGLSQQNPTKLLCHNGVDTGVRFDRPGEWVGKTMICGNANPGFMSADKGSRRLPPEFSEEIKKKIRGTRGLLGSTPCPPGTFGPYCKECPVGFFRDIYFADKCKECDDTIWRNYTDKNSCDTWTCNTKITYISQKINP
jgi:hypothetical protein